MKYIVVLGDGMADYPVPELGDRTPLQAANKPNMDFLAKKGTTGLVKTIPEGIPPGSDAANLSVMGFNPRLYYTGRSPLEAISMGINLSANDIAFRCNLVTLSDDKEYSNKKMIDYSSDEITTGEAKELIDTINSFLKTDYISFYPGISYRHCMVWKDGHAGFNCIPPHDISGKIISDFLPKGENSSNLLDIMVKSYGLLNDHPINKSRISRGLRPANSLWLWGEGKKPALPKFKNKYGIKGSVISAVDLIKGIGICAGLDYMDVEGATGNIHTNFRGKAEAALRELASGKDFVYVHIEAPDECGHRFEIENKVKSIELIDNLVVGTLLEGLRKYDDYRILILPDHATPLALGTHTREPVPFILYQKGDELISSEDKASPDIEGYDEFQAKSTGIFIEEGYTIMDFLININNKDSGTV